MSTPGAGCAEGDILVRTRFLSAAAPFSSTREFISEPYLNFCGLSVATQGEEEGLDVVVHALVNWCLWE